MRTIFYDNDDIKNIRNIKISDIEKHNITDEITKIIDKLYSYCFTTFKNQINKFVGKSNVTINEFIDSYHCISTIKNFIEKKLLFHDVMLVL
ncbi:MAG: hypothetical protein IJ848_02150 [Alphaproteobacteria bacterium]|nr:hypothetical protein [Alphaproteobacteria bacterium]